MIFKSSIGMFSDKLMNVLNRNVNHLLKSFLLEMTKS